MDFKEGFLSLFFPRFCLNCHRRGKYFCSSCQKKIVFNRENICPVCERPAFWGETHPRCKTRYSLDGLTSIFAYQGIIKKAIWEIKYRFVFDICQELVDLMPVADLGEFSRTSIILVPIPLFWTKRLWRGFNQSEVLGNLLAKKLGIPFISVLRRRKKTLAQVHLEEKVRKENIKGAFVIKKGVKIPKKILLFDDVWTTGATMREAAKVFKRAGAKFVWGLTIAS